MVAEAEGLTWRRGRCDSQSCTRSPSSRTMRAAIGSSSTPPKVLVQGLVVPLTVRLDWLWEACSHPDGWLYACVVRTPGDDDARAGEPVIT